jgi:hypothetical protein
MASRFASIPIALIAAAASYSAPANADATTPTQVITTVAVGSDGQPINGYQEVHSDSGGEQVSDCSTPSPSAVADNIYYCSPTAASAANCWPAGPGSLLCLDDPWDRRLHRVTYNGPLPPVQPPATPDPFALVLDGGIRCTLRNGGAWGGRDDGYVTVYGCDGPSPDSGVLWLPSEGAGTCIDRSTPVWTVRVGHQTGATPPEVRAVTTAWFAGN